MIKLYRKYLKYYKKEVILGPLFKLLEAIFELFIPLVVASLINEGINQNNLKHIINMFIVLMILAIVGLLSTLVCQYFASKASQGVGTLVRNDLYKHILNLEKASFDKFNIPMLTTVMNNDTKQFEYSVAMLIRLVIRAPFIVIGSIIMSFILNINYGLIVLLSAFILIPTVLYLMYKTIPLNKKVSSNIDLLSNDVKEAVLASDLIRSFNNEIKEENEFKQHLDNLYLKNKKVALFNALLNPISSFIINTTIIILLLISYNLANSNLILNGDLVALINYMNQIIVASSVVCNLVLVFSKTLVSSNRINKVLDAQNILNFSDKTEINRQKEVFNVNNLTYRFYENSNNILNDITFNVNEGEFICLTGTTGSGKTTLLNLIAHLIEPTSGNISYYDNDLNNYDKKFYYNQIAYNMQKNMFLNKSIEDNIKFYNNKEVDQKIYEDSLAVNIIKKKDNGALEMLYDNATNLSGGEKKRVLLARTLYRNSNVILLDQSLAGLDNNSLKQICINLKALNKTIIIVSDSLYVMQLADRIIVLDNGYLVGNDNFNNLRQNNIYFKGLIGDYNE